MDDLPNDELRLIAETLGVAAAVTIWRKLAGTTLTLPVRMPREYAIRFIGQHFNGRNVPQLARALGISGRTVQEYLGARPAQAKRPKDESQLSLL